MRIKKDREFLWQSVKADIEARIIRGEYKSGDLVPSITSMTEKYQIGRTTAQKILNSLCDEGIIVKRVGIGCFVAPKTSVKDKLLSKNMQRIQGLALQRVKEARALDIDCEQLLQMVKDKFNS